jgi:hypothetical protein
MQEPNSHGVYEPQTIIELARWGRSYVHAMIAQCEDGLYRFALTIHTSYVGRSGPITAHTDGFATARAAEDAALFDALAQFPKPFSGDPQSVHIELAALRGILEERRRQPMLL